MACISILNSGRQTGKTAAAVTWFCQLPGRRIIVCINDRERQRVEQLCQHELGRKLTLCEEACIVAWHEIQRGDPFNLERLPVLFDNLDIVLGELLRSDTILCTVSVMDVYSDNVRTQGDGRWEYE